MRNIKLSIEYDGTNYHGWQSQKKENTIQKVIECSIERIINSRVKLIGAGRTDAGVHALDQVANFLTDSEIPAELLKRGLNSILPYDIKIKDIEESPTDFHARLDAKGKIYQYMILNSEYPSPFLNRYSWHIKKNLDLEAMEEGSKYFIGEKDFSAFMASGSRVNNRIREIRWARWTKRGDIIIFSINANGFLRHMVRIIVGTIVYIGLGKLSTLSIEDIFNSKDRKKAGITAPPQGLFLKKVIY
jgi:tRNA pseudouridine38-40 synthase